jgi:type IV conjugative transfer system protein TraL
MSDDGITKVIPAYLSQPIQVLWLEIDELALFFVGGFIFLLFSNKITFITMFLIPWMYSKAKKKYPRGFLQHTLYFMGFIKLERYPSYFEDHFVE